MEDKVICHLDDMLQMRDYQGQSFYYFNHGYREALLTPREYFTKLTDYSEGDKRLNYIVSYFSSKCNTNIILKIGFGTGILERKNQSDVVRYEKHGAPYQLKVGLYWTPKIPYENPDTFLTFRWFKNTVICKDQSWICRKERSIKNWFAGWGKQLSQDRRN